MSTYTDFLRDAAQYHHDHPAQRKGQAYFNYYAITYPSLANKVWGGMLDPFNDDSRLGAFLEAVAYEMEEAA